MVNKAGKSKPNNYMSASLSYKPGAKNKGGTKSPLERSKEYTEKIRERARKAAEESRSRDEQIASQYRNLLNSDTAVFEKYMNDFLMAQFKEYSGITEEIDLEAKAWYKAMVDGTLPAEEVAENESVSESSSVGGNYSNTSTYYKSSRESQYQAYIEKYAKQYNLDPNLVASVITIESGWNPNAVSSANCKGLMQVNPRYVGGNLYDPQKNIQEGCRILRECMNAYPNSLEHALTAYNRGITGAKNVPTSSYSNKVMNEYNNRTSLAQNNKATPDKKIDYSA